jgi:hypothetical protein
VGGKDHKAFARYQSADNLSALDVTYYKGWHSESPTTEEMELEREIAEDCGEEYIPNMSICGPKCAQIGLSEGANQARFEQFIDTDEHWQKLPRIPLYTFGDGVKTIYIPQIEELIVREQAAIDGRADPWNAPRSWQLR